MTRLFHLLRLALAGLAVLASTSAFAQYPNRPLTLVVPWGAGGGTDAVARFIASLMEKDLGQPVNVVNRTGGSGVVGHSAIATAAPDGYTIGMITVEITMMHHQKLTELDPTSYTPIALVNLDPAGFQVRADSPYKTMADVLAAIKAAPPGKFKASGTGQGGIWHLALAGMLSDLKIDPASVPWVPSNGAAPGLQDLVAGGVEFVPSSLPEALAGGYGRAPRIAVPRRAHAEGGDRLELGHRRVARHRRPQGLAGRRAGQARSLGEEGLRQQGLQGLHGAARLRHAVGQLGRVRQVHGQGRRRHEGGDDGGGHRQVGTGALALHHRHTTAPVPVQRTDRWVGLALALLALLVLWSARAFPNVPGQKLGAAFLPMLVGAGLLLCGAALLVRSLRARAYAHEADAEAPAAEHFGSSVAIVGAVVAYIALSERVGFLLIAPLSLLVVFLALRVRWPVSVLWALAGTALVHVAFYKLLRVPLPWGWFTPFY
jgi:Tripartite tricarboxylate transporter family receptor/Tripartite tricarboxylate transporter TctB family